MTKANVIQLGLLVFVLGGIFYGAFIALGLDQSKAGIAAEAVLVLIVCLWSVSYFFRVITGNMTFMEQRKRYRKAYEELAEAKLLEKFDSMSEDEKINLIKELEIDKK